MISFQLTEDQQVLKGKVESFVIEKNVPFEKKQSCDGLTEVHRWLLQDGF